MRETWRPRRRRTFSGPWLLCGLVCLLFAGVPAFGEPAVRNGFLLEPSSVPVDEILGGGPPKDGIPALDHPETVGAAAAPWDDDHLVIGLERNGEARAYPIGILNWHELVNDTLGGQPLLVSFCPLCGTGIVFDRRIGGEEHHFGVSGLLYRSDLLMYDQETQSLWSQISAKAVTGPLRGEHLQQIRSTMVPWGSWRDRHPRTTVLSRHTGHKRNYDRSPYGDYQTSKKLIFPVPLDDRYHPKEQTLGLRAPGGASRAYPAFEVRRAGGVIEEKFGGEDVRVAYDDETQSFQIRAPGPLEVVEGYWFAWTAFHPDTTVFVSSAPGYAGAGTQPTLGGGETR